ncbi:hypothetical protein SBA7_1610009 [Candidatus Sulfotelmatobacter sp. SbA7]|nr:hypothetical protein SBA7_1610009 [Candidatus Sulfotelmatobacter sp. SbA7]
MRFGIIADDWGEAKGEEIAVAQLEKWVKDLSASCTTALYADLVKSDTAYGDDPIWQTPQMSALFEAQIYAQRQGMTASEDGVNDGHDCQCRLAPVTDGS